MFNRSSSESFYFNCVKRLNCPDGETEVRQNLGLFQPVWQFSRGLRCYCSMHNNTNKLLGQGHFKTWVVKLTMVRILFQSIFGPRSQLLCYTGFIILSCLSFLRVYMPWCSFVNVLFQLNSKLRNALWQKFHYFKGHVICCAFQNVHIGKTQSNFIVDCVLPVRHRYNLTGVMWDDEIWMT